MYARVVYVQDGSLHNDGYTVELGDREHVISISNDPGPDWYCTVHQTWDCMDDEAVKSAVYNAPYPPKEFVGENGDVDVIAHQAWLDVLAEHHQGQDGPGRD